MLAFFLNWHKRYLTIFAFIFQITHEITGLKIVNIFSFQDSSPAELLNKLEKQKKLHGGDVQKAMKDLNEGNDYKKSWNTVASKASLIVAAWGNCAGNLDINQRKSEVRIIAKYFPIPNF